MYAENESTQQQYTCTHRICIITCSYTSIETCYVHVNRLTACANTRISRVDRWAEFSLNVHMSANHGHNFLSNPKLKTRDCECLAGHMDLFKDIRHITRNFKHRMLGLIQEHTPTFWSISVTMCVWLYCLYWYPSRYLTDHSRCQELSAQNGR